MQSMKKGMTISAVENEDATLMLFFIVLLLLNPATSIFPLHPEF
jgi:hypothetical protein